MSGLDASQVTWRLFHQSASPLNARPDRAVWIFLAPHLFAAKTPVYERWISLDFLGFSRPNLGFSMGCADFSAKKFSRRFCRSVEARNGSLRFAYGARIAHRPSLTEFRIFCNRLWSEPFPFDLNPKAASLSQLPFDRTAIVIATHRASLKPYGFLAMTSPPDRSALVL